MNDTTAGRLGRDLIDRYKSIRQRSLDLCAPLTIEDHVPQPIVEVSPPKWHLGHTTWFFETLILKEHQAGYRLFDPAFNFLFNSYYESQGPRVERAGRGGMSRPTVAEICAYRFHVDEAMRDLLVREQSRELAHLIELGLNHEEQHQELLLTDIKFILWSNLNAPAYSSSGRSVVEFALEHSSAPQDASWVEWLGGVSQVGHTDDSFAFDNELPQHEVLVHKCALRTTLVTNREYLAFMKDDGYLRPEFWHSDGIHWVRTNRIEAPLYWDRHPSESEGWRHFTLRGLVPLLLDSPVSHVSYYEASAFAQWAGARLPTEFEWETLSSKFSWGERWEWTESSYKPYPGFVRASGAVGEYNGKFMVDQQVLRGASFATPSGHSRATYRNFFQARQRWQYTGIRLASETSW